MALEDIFCEALDEFLAREFAIAKRVDETSGVWLTFQAARKIAAHPQPTQAI